MWPTYVPLPSFVHDEILLTSSARGVEGGWLRWSDPTGAVGCLAWQVHYNLAITYLYASAAADEGEIMRMKELALEHYIKVGDGAAA
jgi:hypothetical protein